MEKMKKGDKILVDGIGVEVIDPEGLREALEFKKYRESQWGCSPWRDVRREPKIKIQKILREERKTRVCPRCGVLKPTRGPKYCEDCQPFVGYRGRFFVFSRDEFKCFYCGRSTWEGNIVLHVDHVNPRDNGGDDSLDNLVTSCRKCNLSKSNRVLRNMEEILFKVRRLNEKTGYKGSMIIKIS
jgi:hypothetical protein